MQRARNRIYVKFSVYSYDIRGYQVIQREYKTASRAFHFYNRLKTLIGLSNRRVARQAGKPYGLLRRWLNHTYSIDGYLVALPGVFHERTVQLEEEPKPVMDDIITPGKGALASAANNWTPEGTSGTYCKFCSRDTNACIAEPCKGSGRPAPVKSINLSPVWPSATQRATMR